MKILSPIFRAILQIAVICLASSVGIQSFGASHYQILGVSKTATRAEIKQAYIKIKKRLEPKAIQGDRTANDELTQVNIAWDALRRTDRRENYDKNGGVELLRLVFGNKKLVNEIKSATFGSDFDSLEATESVVDYFMARPNRLFIFLMADPAEIGFALQDIEESKRKMFFRLYQEARRRVVTLYRDPSEKTVRNYDLDLAVLQHLRTVPQKAAEDAYWYIEPEDFSAMGLISELKLSHPEFANTILDIVVLFPEVSIKFGKALEALEWLAPNFSDELQSRLFDLFKSNNLKSSHSMTSENLRIELLRALLASPIHSFDIRNKLALELDSQNSSLKTDWGQIEIASYLVKHETDLTLQDKAIKYLEPFLDGIHDMQEPSYGKIKAIESFLAARLLEERVYNVLHALLLNPALNMSHKVSWLDTFYRAKLVTSRLWLEFNELKSQKDLFLTQREKETWKESYHEKLAEENLKGLIEALERSKPRSIGILSCLKALH